MESGLKAIFKISEIKDTGGHLKADENSSVEREGGLRLLEY